MGTINRSRSDASREFENFDRTMRELIKVPHSEIKAKLEAEKADKSRKRSNSEKNSKPVARIAKKDH